MSTPSLIPGVDREALARVLRTFAPLAATGEYYKDLADAALAHIADHHECACDREHADEWVEVDEDDWVDLPDGTRLRREWERGAYAEFHHFVYRDDLPDADLVERMATAIWSAGEFDGEWSDRSSAVQEKYRKAARAALAVYREGEPMTLTRPRYSPGGWTDAPAALGAGRGLPARTAQPNRRRDQVKIEGEKR